MKEGMVCAPRDMMNLINLNSIWIRSGAAYENGCERDSTLAPRNILFHDFPKT